MDAKFILEVDHGCGLTVLYSDMETIIDVEDKIKIDMTAYEASKCQICMLHS